MPRYNPATIEPKWQRYWDEHRTFAAPRLPDGEKLYVLDMFPYPSGDGLHVGHPEGYTATDIFCRAARMQGKSVVHPMGFDAFGLPAEEHAIKTGTHPRIQTEANIDNFRRQLKMLGFSYDWQRELATTDPSYFRWTQWIFLQLFDTWFDSESGRGRPMDELPIPADVESAGPRAVGAYRDARRLAFQSEAPVNWCPNLGTVLANEEVQDGKSERGGHPVVRLPLRQWMLRITAYADRLERELELVDWPESIKTLQRNWIGRSTGAEVDFFIGEGPAADSGEPDPSGFEAFQARRREQAFPQEPSGDVIRVYTTRPDTLFGATYMVLAPEHPFVERLCTPAQAEAVRDYCDRAALKSDLDRTDLAKEKTGVFTGSSAINPINGERIPVWVADYVLASYGTGAIMAVPAHDERDFEFATQFKLPIRAVVAPAPDRFEKWRSDPPAGLKGLDPETWEEAILAGQAVYAADGKAVHSGKYDGLETGTFKKQITADLAAAGVGRHAVNYKLRDWLFSRQRFWGEPFPILHELDASGEPTGSIRGVEENELPVDLPHLDDFKPRGRPEPPLEKAPDTWLYVERDGKRYKRETNTMPQWAGSCWYYLRFLDPENDSAPLDPEIERAWMPIDLYVGGAEHAVLHLLYARFWHKVLYDRGVVSSPEPFVKLVNQGMILGEPEITGYQDAGGAWVSADQVEHGDPGPVHQETSAELEAVSIAADATQKRGDRLVLADDPGIQLDNRASKMSKSRGNVVNPDTVVAEYGADALRLYEMFMGPLEQTKPWSMKGVDGVRGFLGRVWRLVVDDRAEETRLAAAVVNEPADEEGLRELHKTIKKVTADIETLSFNTAIARMMEFTNFFTKRDQRPREILEPFVLLLSPFAPHLAEELWHVLGHSETLAYEPWPAFDEALTRDATIEMPVQINGKLRSRVAVDADADREAMESAARGDEKIARDLEGKVVRKVVVVPGRLINFVIQP